MGLTRLAVYRPILAVTLLVSLILAGLLSYANLGLDQLPDIRPPIITIQVAYPGAGPEDVEQQVTRKIEDAVAALNDIEELSSTSSQGAAIVTVRFRESVNVDLMALDVERAVNNIRRELPTEVEAPTIRKLDLNDQPIMYLALWTHQSRDGTELFRVADEQIRPRLEGLEGISAARPLGGQKPEIQVEVDPDRLRAYNLSILDVTQALSAQYQSVAGGLVRTGQGETQREFGLRVEGRERDVAAVRALNVTNRDGINVQLGTIARVGAGGAEQVSIVRLNGRNALGVLVSKQTQANITQAADKVLAELPHINASLPPDLRLDVVVDRSSFVRSSLVDVQRELAAAAALTGLVLLLFLHTIRATVIVLVAIPTCIVATFVVMKSTGLTLNILSLLGLTTSIGLLVDDSIVVLENIFRKLEQGRNPLAAAIEGRSEIGLAAIAITLVDVVVFGPIIFLTGTTGGFLRNFAIVITAATLTSLLVSFTLTPMLASRWLSLGGKRSLLTRVVGSWEPGYRWFERRYAWLLGWSLRHRLIVVFGALALIIGSFGLVPRLGVEFVPDVDSPFIVMAGEMPGGTGLAATDQVARRWERMLLDQEQFPEIKTVYLVVGAGSTELDRGVRFLSAIVELSPRRERNRTSSQVQRAALEAARAIPDLQTSVGGNRAGGPGQAIQFRIFGTEIGELGRWAGEAQRRLAAQPELADVSNNTAVVSPEIVARVEPQRLQDFGLTTQQVGAAVRIGYQGVVPARYPRADGTEVDIRVRFPEALRGSPERLQDLPLVTTRGTLVTLGQVAELEHRAIPARIMRIGRQRVAIVGADPRGVPLGAATAVATREMAAIPWPAGARWEIAGQSKEQQQSFAQFGMALLASVLLVYLVLTTLYESVVYPLVVLSALPLALIGALGGLLLFNQTLSILALIGLIALFGLVGKNSILLVDYTNQLRRQGIPRNEALLRAGPARLRPILMTSATLVLGLMPVALRLGEGGELRAPLAAVIIGGMISSTVLTLVFVPVSYTFFDGLQRRVMGFFGPRPAPVELAADGHTPAGEVKPPVEEEPEPAGEPAPEGERVRSG